MQTIFIFFLFCIELIRCASNESRLGTLTIDNQAIPAYVNGSGNYKGKKTENVILQSAEFHEQFIIPRQEFFEITHTPVVCYGSEYDSQAIIPNYQETHLQVIEINNQDQNFKNFVINHEMVHLYLNHKYDKTCFNFKECFYFTFKNFSFFSLAFFIYTKIYPIIVNYNPQHEFKFLIIGLLLLEQSTISGFFSLITLFLSHRNNYYQRIEEFFCDAKGISYGSKKEQLKTIKKGIKYFQQAEEPLTFKEKIIFLLFGKTHPSHTARIEQLEQLKKLIINDKKEELEDHLNNQERILKTYYQSFLTNPKQWIKIQFMNLKNRLTPNKVINQKLD